MVAGRVAAFGDAAAQLRAPSVLSGTLAVPVAFLAAHDLGGRWAGHAAALLTAIAPFAVTHAQEARPQALAMLPVRRRVGRLTVELKRAHQGRTLDPAQVLPAAEAFAEAGPDG